MSDVNAFFINFVNAEVPKKRLRRGPHGGEVRTQQEPSPSPHWPYKNGGGTVEPKDVQNL